MPEANTGRAEGAPRRAARGAARSGVFWAWLVLSGVACSGAEERPPTAVLSRSIAAEGEIRGLIAAWARGSRAERMTMEPALATFRDRHHGDDLARLADALLAWIEVDRACDPLRRTCDEARLGSAAAHAHQVRTEAGPGTVADIACTVEGAALRRQGRAAAALDLLLPLEDKLIDPWARSLHQEEALAAAVDAGRFKDALRLMRVWLRTAGAEEQATVRGTVEAALARVPAEDLLALLDAQQPASTSGDEDRELRRLVARRLVRVARDRKDAHLAQHILSVATPLLGDQGDVVAQLATAASKARVEARTVGLAISSRSERTRRRGADIAEGVAFGLGLPGAAARLVSRDDHGSLDRLAEALAALSTDGASVLIAGGDAKEAAVAAAFAEAHRIPVLLLHAPPPGTGGRFSFVVGAADDDVEGALIAALSAHGASPVILLTDDPARPRPPRPEVVAIRGCAEAAAPWKGTGAAGVVLTGEPACSSAALAAAFPLRLRFAAGLEADGLLLPPGSFVASAGAFPSLSTSPTIASWLEAHPAPPDWWAALGRDAAVLAWAGVQVLPTKGTEDVAQVQARRAQAAAALAAARAELWTTDSGGFGGGRSLARVIHAREPPPVIGRQGRP